MSFTFEGYILCTICSSERALTLTINLWIFHRLLTLGILLLLQLLNALFGLNVAMQHMHMYSPFLCSLPYALKTPPAVTPSEYVRYNNFI